MNEIPLYQVIINDLIAAIERGDYDPGDKLPSQHRLMQEYKVSRITAIRALTELESSGWIVRKKGSGSYVSKRISSNGSNLLQEHPLKERLVGVIVPFLSMEDVQSNHMKYLQGINEYLSQKSYGMMFYGSTCKMGEEQLLTRAISDGCDGIIHYPYYRDCYPLLLKLATERYPLVLLDQQYASMDVTSVLTDNYKASYDAAKFLLNKGYRRIGYLTNTSLYSDGSVRDRYRGYCQALSDGGIELDIRLTQVAYKTASFGEDPEISRETYLGKMEKAVDQLVENGCDAVMAHSDYLARDIVQICSQKGISVPHRLAVVGFDDLAFCTYTTPSITSIRQDFFRIGYTAAQKLCLLLEEPNRKREKILLDASVIPRETT